MATIRDVLDVCRDISVMITFFGATPEALNDFERRKECVRNAIMEEQNISDPAEAAKLPGTTILGKKAEAALESLKELVPRK